jgi:hypothetical protein
MLSECYQSLEALPKEPQFFYIIDDYTCEHRLDKHKVAGHGGMFPNPRDKLCDHSIFQAMKVDSF